MAARKTPFDLQVKGPASLEKLAADHGGAIPGRLNGAAKDALADIVGVTDADVASTDAFTRQQRAVA